MAITTALVAAVVSIAATAYSVYSSIEASHDKKEGPMVVAEPRNTAADEAAAAEATRIRKRRALASTIKTSAGGLAEAPTVMKQTLGD